MIPGPKVICQILTPTEISDSMGGFTTSWTTLYSVSGVLTRPSINSRYNESQLQDKQTLIANYVFFMEYKSNVTEKCKLVYGTREFDIIWVYNPGTMGHHLELYLKETK